MVAARRQVNSSQFGSARRAGSVKMPVAGIGLAYYYATVLPILLGVWIGTEFLQIPGRGRGYWGNFTQLDGIAYSGIATTGYWYNPAHLSNVVYFPAYPMVGRVLARSAGLPAELALVIVSHVALASSFILFAHYLTLRTSDNERVVGWTLLALGLWPTGLYFRMGYSESLFLLLLVAAMYGMLRGWPSVVVALIIGAATATRSPGIALVPVFAIHLWQTSPTGRSRATRILTLAPLSLWGLATYMLYLYLDFGNPLLFATEQARWMHGSAEWSERAVALLTLEPLWSPFVPSSPAHWGREGLAPILSFGFVNPIVFAFSVLLVAAGGWTRWLNASETLLCACLLLVPYVAAGYDNLMLSQPRFASVAFPLYLVLGHLLSRARWGAAGIACVGCAALLVLYTAMFAAGHGWEYKVLY